MASNSSPWGGSVKHVSESFENVTGSILDRKVREVYVRPGGKLWIPWYKTDKEGKQVRTMVRAPENSRHQTTTRKRYTHILSQGLNMAQRSEAIAYPSEPEGTFIVTDGKVSFPAGSACTFLLYAGATLMEAA